MPKRRGRPSAAQTPAPNSDKISGSSKNKAGSATNKGSSKINLSEKTVNSLKQKLENFKKDNPSKKNIDLNDLKAVYRRGSGAYSSSHRPTITGGAPNSRAAWSYARVNKFLKKASGEKVKAAYVQDDDLMAKGGVIENQYFVIIKYNQDSKGRIIGKYKNLGRAIARIKSIKEDNNFYESLEIHPNYKTKNIFGDEGIYPIYIYDLGQKDSEVIFPNNLEEEKILTENFLLAKRYEMGGETDSGGQDGEMGKEIICMGCGWSWNTNNSDEHDKYICHKCGFDNRIFYDSDPIGYADGGLIAPNGKPSNLTPEQYKLVRTPEFKAWFGDWENDPENASKVVDENGEPLVVYRGDISKFDVLEPNNHQYGKIWFSDNYEVAKTYTLDPLHAQDGKSVYKGVVRAFFLNVKDLRINTSVKISERNKNVGILVTNQYDPAYDLSEGKIDLIANNYVAFYPNQIKLADGSNTTFDAENPDIRYEDGGLLNALTTGMQNLDKNGIVLKDNDETITLIAYNTGNQERKPSLYNKSLIYQSVKPIKSANEIIQNFDFQEFENFSEDKLEAYKKSHLIILNQNEVVYDSKNPDIIFEYGGLIAPNGKKSNLTLEQYNLVRTPQFKAWFGDWENDPENASKVVDENGEPKVCYHTTLEEFSKFNLGKKSKVAILKGAYFSNEPITDWSGTTKGYFLNIKNPLKLDRSKNKRLSTLDIQSFIKEQQWIYLSDLSNISFQEMRDKFDSYDGIIIDNVAYSTHTKEYVIHKSISTNPTQIKLADGSNTTFDANNPDIRYEAGGKTPDFEVVLIEHGSLLENEAYDIVSNEIGATGMPRLGLLENNKLIGAVYIEPPSEYDLNGVHTVEPLYEYKFDIFIKRNKRNKGYSKLLLDSIIKDYVENFDDTCDQIRAEVINKKLEKSLQKNYDFSCDSGNEENITYCYLQREDAKKLYNMKMNQDGGAIKAAKGKKIEAKGDCYYIAGQFAMHKMLAPAQIDFKGEPYLVHAEVKGQGKIEGLRYGHAWIEDDENIYDYSNGRQIVLPKMIYYLIGDIRTDDPKKYMKYTFSEARRKMVDTGTYGSWDIDTLYEDGGLVAPNGKKSKLTAEQYKLVRTPEFKAWFGDWENDPENASKVVDQNGEPKVYYQGHPYSEYPEGKNLYEKDNNGIFFTANKIIAQTYGMVKSVFINSRNPKDIRNYYGYDNKKISSASRNDNKYWYKADNEKEYLNSDPNVIKFYEDVIDKYGNKVLEIFDRTDGVNEYKNKQEIKEFLIPTSKKGFKFLNFKHKSSIWDLVAKYMKDSQYDGIFATDEDKLSEDIADSVVVYDSNQIKLADGRNTTFDANNPDIRYEEGGTLYAEGGTLPEVLKEPKSLKEIAIEHRVNIKYLKEQLKIGSEHEKEHLKSKKEDSDKVAETIALHHLAERPDYYEVLAELQLEDGGELDEDVFENNTPIEVGIIDFIASEKMEANQVLMCSDSRIFKSMICKTKIEIAEKRGKETENPEEKNAWQACENIWKSCYDDVLQNNIPKYSYKDGGTPCGCGTMYKRGGLAYGNSHDKGGMPLKVQSTGQNIEIEGGEGVVNKRSMQIEKKLEFEGKKMTACEVISKINEMGGGVKFKCADVANIIAEDGNF